QSASRLHQLAVLGVEVGAARQEVGHDLVARLVGDDYARLLRVSLGREFGDLLLDVARLLVYLLLEGGAGDDVLVADVAVVLGDYRVGERVESGQGAVRRHYVAGVHDHLGAVAHVDLLVLGYQEDSAGDYLGIGYVRRLGDGLVGLLDDGIALEDPLAVLHEDLVALADLEVGEDLAGVEGPLAGEEGASLGHLNEGARDLGDEDRVLEVDAVLLGDLGRRAADMEGAHRELSARLADGLGGDDAHRLADLHGAAGGQVAAVALAADAVPGLAGQHRPDGDFLYPGLVDLVGDLLGDLLVRGDDEVPRDRVADGIEGVAP